MTKKGKLKIRIFFNFVSIYSLNEKNVCWTYYIIYKYQPKPFAIKVLVVPLIILQQRVHCVLHSCWCKLDYIYQSTNTRYILYSYCIHNRIINMYSKMKYKSYIHDILIHLNIHHSNSCLETTVNCTNSIWRL